MSARTRYSTDGFCMDGGLGRTQLMRLWRADAAATADDSWPSLERLEALEKTQAEQAQALQERDARIAELEARLAEVRGQPSEPSQVAQAPAEELADQPVVAAAETATDAPVETYDEPEYFGQFQPGGKGFRLANTPYGDVNFSYYAYARYLNQDGLDDTYTDYFGRTQDAGHAQRPAVPEGRAVLQGLGG